MCPNCFFQVSGVAQGVKEAGLHLHRSSRNTVSIGIYMHACIYMYIYVYIYTYTCIYVCTDICIYIHIYLWVRYTYIHMHAYSPKKDTCLHICIYIHIYTHIITCVHIHIDRDIYILVWGNGLLGLSSLAFWRVDVYGCVGLELSCGGVSACTCRSCTPIYLYICRSVYIYVYTYRSCPCTHMCMYIHIYAFMC